MNILDLKPGDEFLVVPPDDSPQFGVYYDVTFRVKRIDDGEHGKACVIAEFSLAYVGAPAWAKSCAERKHECYFGGHVEVIPVIPVEYAPAEVQ